MPPRKSQVVAPVEDDEEEGGPLDSDEAFDTALGIAVSGPSSYGEREPRTMRENHSLNVSHLGNIKAYTFMDVLEYAYDNGFLGFVDAEADVYPGGGPDGDEPLAVVTVTAAFRNSQGEIEYFKGVGDASPSNCNARVGKHFVRMAETRAQGRVLGRVLNLSAITRDELGDDDDAVQAPRATAGPKQTYTPRQNRGNGGGYKDLNDPVNWPPPNDGNGGWECEVTHEPVTGKQAAWSLVKVGKIVNWDTQQELLKAKG